MSPYVCDSDVDDMTDMLEVSDCSFGFGWSSEEADTWKYNGSSGSTLNHNGLVKPPSAPISGDAGPAQDIREICGFLYEDFSFRIDFGGFLLWDNVTTFMIVEEKSRILTEKYTKTVEYLGSEPLFLRLGVVCPVKEVEAIRLCDIYPLRLFFQRTLWLQGRFRLKGIELGELRPGSSNQVFLTLNFEEVR